MRLSRQSKLLHTQSVVNSLFLQRTTVFHLPPLPPSFYPFSIGELYLFHKNNPLCPAESSLWGFYDRRYGSVIYLESSSKDLRFFRMRDILPAGYRYVRLSSRDELRDYMWRLGYFEAMINDKL